MSQVKGLLLGRLEDAAESRVGPRTAIVPVRFTPLERERFDEITQEMGLSLPAYIRRVVLVQSFPRDVLFGRYLLRAARTRPDHTAVRQLSRLEPGTTVALEGGRSGR